MRQTFMTNESNIERKWYVIDAEGQTLGRLSSEVASILRGKNKVTYTKCLTHNNCPPKNKCFVLDSRQT
jgi:ribosomal protein L13